MEAPLQLQKVGKINFRLKMLFGNKVQVQFLLVHCRSYKTTEEDVYVMYGSLDVPNHGEGLTTNVISVTDLSINLSKQQDPIRIQSCALGIRWWAGLPLPVL